MWEKRVAAKVRFLPATKRSHDYYFLFILTTDQNSCLYLLFEFLYGNPNFFFFLQFRKIWRIDFFSHIQRRIFKKIKNPSFYKKEEKERKKNLWPVLTSFYRQEPSNFLLFQFYIFKTLDYLQVLSEKNQENNFILFNSNSANSHEKLKMKKWGWNKKKS